MTVSHQMRALGLSMGMATAIIACGNGTETATGSEALSQKINLVPALNASGVSQTYSTTGGIDFSNEFFKSLGTNGRSCATCHALTDGWSVTPTSLRIRFALTKGLDPIFRPNDGSNSPTADTSTLDARKKAYSMLLSRGVFRVGIGIPPNADFELVGIDDPYHFASAQELSLFRRPLPSANLTFLSAVMWDARETIAANTIEQDLSHQANGATLGHAQAVSPLTEQQRQSIVAFETKLFVAQAYDTSAGELSGAGAKGGPVALSAEPFHLGINDTFNQDPSGAPFNPVAMTLYTTAWTGLGGSTARANARASIVRGQALFNSRSFQLVGVRGLNDVLGAPSIPATCTTCHNSPNVGNHSVALAVDLGLTDSSRRTPDMPLYTLRNKGTGETIQTMDPGRALITGQWADLSKFKGPILRALAARPPYFHDGSAATLEDAVSFYDQRFHIGFTSAEKTDLAAFLSSL